MITFSPAAIDWLERFAARQSAGGALFRLAAEKEGCGLLEYALYLSERLPDDRLYHFARASVAVDRETGEVLGCALVDVDEEGALEVIPARKIGAGCPAGSDEGCTAKHPKKVDSG